MDGERDMRAAWRPSPAPPPRGLVLPLVAQSHVFHEMTQTR